MHMYTSGPYVCMHPVRNEPGSEAASRKPQAAAWLHARGLFLYIKILIILVPKNYARA